MKSSVAIIIFSICCIVLFPGTSLSQEVNKLDNKIKRAPTGFFFAGIGSSYHSVKDISEIDESFISQDPFGGIDFFGGISFFKGLAEISLELSRSYGIITHDNSKNLPYYGYKLFYVDRIETNISGYGVNIGLHPMSGRMISPVLSVSLKSNSYKKYSRSIYEEILVTSTNLVVNNYFDEFDKPDGFQELNIKAGIDLKINDRNHLRSFVSYSYIKKSSYGIQNIKSTGILYKRNFR